MGWTIASCRVRSLGTAPMDDDEIHLHVTYASHWDVDDAFCARMRKAIFAGQENAPVGVVRAEPPRPLASSSLADMDF